MKNQYPAKCCVCGQTVGPRDGVVCKQGGFWRVRHEMCKVKNA